MDFIIQDGKKIVINTIVDAGGAGEMKKLASILGTTIFGTGIILALPLFADENAKREDWYLTMEMDHYEYIDHIVPKIYTSTLKLYGINPNYVRHIRQLSKILIMKTRWIVLKELVQQGGYYSILALYLNELDDQWCSWRVNDRQEPIQDCISMDKGKTIDGIMKNLPERSVHSEFLMTMDPLVTYIAANRGVDEVLFFSVVNPSLESQAYDGTECWRVTVDEDNKVILKKESCPKLSHAETDQDYKTISGIYNRLMELQSR